MDTARGSRLRRPHLGLACLWICLVLLATMASPLLAARTMRPLEIKQRYTMVLGILATGDLDQAVADLVKLETTAVGDQQPWRHVDDLWRAKLHLIRDLLASERFDLLKPIVMLHHDAYFSYSSLGRRYLAQHSRTMSSELAEILVERHDSPVSRAFAGWTITSFAAYLWSPSDIGRSAQLFFRAVEVEPGNELALRGLSAAYERNGEYEKAIEFLQKALAQEPGDPELSLRLALCHLRFSEGEHERALRTLAALAAAKNPAWIRSVAYQELTRARLAADDESGAEATLREGLGALPGDQQLSIQLASILGGQQRRAEAIAALDAIEIYGEERESARQVYDFWVPPNIDHIRVELRAAMETGLDALAEAVASAPTEGVER